jgi:hypothetical protein
MCVRRMIAYVPRFLNSVLKRYGVYDREGFIPKPILYVSGGETDPITWNCASEPVAKFSGQNFDTEWISPGDTCGNYMWGGFYGSIDKFGHFYVAGRSVNKMHPNGSIIWRCLYRSEVGDLGEPAIDSDCNIYLANDEYRFKLDSEGQVLWEHAQQGRYGAPTILTKNEDYWYVVGPWGLGPITSNSGIAKINTNTGDIEWSRKLNNGVADLKGNWYWLEVDALDKVYCFNAAQVSGGAYCARYDHEGNLEWHANLGTFYGRPVLHSGYMYMPHYASYSYVRKYDPDNPGSGIIASTANLGSNQRFHLFSVEGRLLAFRALGTAQGIYEINPADMKVTRLKDLTGTEYTGPEFSMQSGVSMKQISLKAPAVETSESTDDKYIYCADNYGRCAKAKLSGEVVWRKKLDASIAWTTRLESMTVDASGNVYICGRKGELHKYDQDGDFVWSWKPSEAYTGWLFEVIAVSDGVIVGDYVNPVNLYKVDFDGNEVWRVEAFNGSGFIAALGKDTSGNIYACCQQSGSPYATMLQKYTSAGVLDFQEEISDYGDVDPDNRFEPWWDWNHFGMYVDSVDELVYVGAVGYDQLNGVLCSQYRAYNFSDFSIAQEVSIENTSDIQITNIVKDNSGNVFAATGDGWAYPAPDYANIFKFSGGTRMAHNYSTLELNWIAIDDEGDVYGIDRYEGIITKHSNSDLSQYPIWLSACDLSYTIKLLIGP